VETIQQLIAFHLAQTSFTYVPGVPIRLLTGV
jgi:hypothetical protein